MVETLTGWPNRPRGVEPGLTGVLRWSRRSRGGPTDHRSAAGATGPSMVETSLGGRTDRRGAEPWLIWVLRWSQRPYRGHRALRSGNPGSRRSPRTPSDAVPLRRRVIRDLPGVRGQGRPARTSTTRWRQSSGASDRGRRDTRHRLADGARRAAISLGSTRQTHLRADPAGSGPAILLGLEVRSCRHRPDHHHRPHPHQRGHLGLIVVVRTSPAPLDIELEGACHGEGPGGSRCRGGADDPALSRGSWSSVLAVQAGLTTRRLCYAAAALSKDVSLKRRNPALAHLARLRLRVHVKSPTGRQEVIPDWQRSVSVRTRPSRARCDASTRRSSRAASSRRLAGASTTRSRA